MNKVAGTLAVVAAAAMIALWTVSALSGGGASAAPPSPHLSSGTTSDNCAACHRSHTAQTDNILASAVPQSTLCFSCHDGTGASTNIAAEYSDTNVPADDAVSSSFYSHPATATSEHTSSLVDEFAGVLNRHSECSDCHNPHTVDAGPPLETGSGWTASQTISNRTGVTGTTPLTWKSSISYEYELCLKCHSRYTELLTYTKESYKKTDKAAEFDPAGASYHPVEAAGTNSTVAMSLSLAGGKLWQFTTDSTIRCTHCHGNYRLVSDPPTANSPAAADRLAPHTSQYRSLLTANYRDRDLKPGGEPYAAGEFALCFLCHSEEPFTGASNQATNFPEHDKHVNGIEDSGDPLLGTDIDTAGAGQGNAICAECHFRLHGTASAYRDGDRDNERLLNFAPNVQPLSGNLEPVWSLADKSCALVCHGKTHDPKTY